MTIADLPMKDFEKELQKIIKGLIEKGFIPSNVNVTDLAHDVAEKLNNDKDINLSVMDLKNNPDKQHALGLACIAQSVRPNKFDETIKALFKPLNELDKEKFKKELKNIFQEALKLNPKFKKKTDEEKAELEAALDDYLEQSSQKLLRPDTTPVYENKYVFNFIAASIDMLNKERKEFYRELYGVAEPGEVQEVIQAVPYGDQIGLLDLTTYGDSFQAKKNEANPGVPDPLGLKMEAIINGLADGMTSIMEMSQTLSDPDIMGPSTPKNKPKGYA